MTTAAMPAIATILRGTKGVPRKGFWTSVNMRVWTCKELRVKHDQASCYLRPPFLGTFLVPSRVMITPHAPGMSACISLSLYIYIYMYTHVMITYVPHISICVYVHMYIHVYVCVYIYIYIYIYVCMYVCTYVCMYVCMYVCVYVYMYVYIYM